MLKDIECPYCQESQDIDHDDGAGYEEDVVYRQECPSCGKMFTYTVYISYSYTPEKADCLNGAPHNWEPTHTFPKEYTKMRCSMCDDERQPTQEEKVKYNLI